MGRSNYSHGKKFDKETQSPVLKIFKEIMTREKDDPEKRNLLMEQKEDKKRRQYSGSRSKMERRSCESSSSEHRKRANLYKVSSTEQRADFNQRLQNTAFEGEKKDSWWCWQNHDKTVAGEETVSCSRVSCASAYAEGSRWSTKRNKAKNAGADVTNDSRLKKIMSSEYACISCLLLLFTISIVVAFLVVFKSVPTLNADIPDTPKTKMDSERLKRKIEMLTENRKNDVTGLEQYRNNDNHGFDDSLANDMGASGVGVEFGPSFRELNALDDSDMNKLSADMDWSSVLETDKTSETQSSEKLREFYKKLVQTDAKIKDLKKLNLNLGYIEADDLLKTPDRSKRSLKLYNYPKRYHVVRRRRSLKDNHRYDNDMRKRHFNRSLTLRSSESEIPSGFVIEKKKLIVQYKPTSLKKKLTVKKCSHAPKDSLRHENQLKHPFYKNTQRLDELLDKFLNKNLPDLMTDPFGLDELFTQSKDNKCKHPAPVKNLDILNKEYQQSYRLDQIPKPKAKHIKVKEVKPTTSNLMKMLRPESSTVYEHKIYMHESKIVKQRQKVVTANPNDFDVLLSVSTIMNPDIKKKTGGILPAANSNLLDKVPNIRRLMQVEGEDDDNLGYEDFKEVLTDDEDNHDDTDKKRDRKKRNEQPSPTAEKYAKFNPPGVHNPNWKGPMPLYPDELNSMIRHAALNANKENLKNLKPAPAPLQNTVDDDDLDFIEHAAAENDKVVEKDSVEMPNTKDLQSLSFVERRIRDLTDVEYVEDYLNNKYDKLIEMAQAYSDYGVLDGKKESRNEKNSASDVTASDHRVQMNSEKRYRSGTQGRIKKGRLPNIVTEVTESGRQQRQATVNETVNVIEQTGGIQRTFLYTTEQPKSEDIRFEIQPTTKSREDDIRLLKLLQKHVKIEPKPDESIYETHLDDLATSTLPNQLLTHKPTFLSNYPEMDLVCSTGKPKMGGAFPTKNKNKSYGIENENSLIFAFGKRRNLLSVNVDTDDYHSDNVSPDGLDAYTRISENSVKVLIQNSETTTQAQTTLDQAEVDELLKYMNKATNKNIRIYSTLIPEMTTHTNSPTTPVYATYETTASFFDDETSMFMIRPQPVTSQLLDINKNEILVTINKSETRVAQERSGNTFEGKILLTVESPEFETEHIDLRFNIPLVINFNDDGSLINDSFSMFENENDNDTDDNDFDPDPDDMVDNERLIRRRYRREDLYITELTFPPKKTNASVDKPVLKLHRTNTHAPVTIEHELGFNPKIHHFKHSHDDHPKPINIEPSSSKSNESDNMTLSDFFKVISDWFKAIEGLKDYKTKPNKTDNMTGTLVNKENSTTESYIKNSTDFIIIDTTTEDNIDNSTDIIYPIFDPDKIDNIGYRSRSLLSVSTLANATNEKKDTEKANDTRVKKEDVSYGNASNTTNTQSLVTNIQINATTMNSNLHTKIRERKKMKKTKAKGKAIFKRNADDSNLIFWNDIYDDEYGIQTDNKLDNSLRSLYSSKENDFIKRSGRWVHDKIRKLAANLKINPHDQDVQIKERIPRSAKKPKIATYPKYLYTKVSDQFMGKDYRDKDDVAGEEEDYDADQKNIFTSLSANMKEVCKKAARAVQQTRNIEVREDSKQGTIATSLMQQLVRLLTDLVDYQVQQKTCTRLPADLQKFLEWLTLPKEDPAVAQQESNTYKTPYQEDDLVEDLELPTDDKVTEKPQDILTVVPMEKQSQTVDARMHHLECLHSIQDLLAQFEDMSDDEKSKMTGVKPYLENQIRFLNKQLAGYDLYSILKKRDHRYKRASKKLANRTQIKRRPKRRINKFIRNFGKKHTRTTASYDDAISVTEMKRKIITSIKNDAQKANDFYEHSDKEVKRNLKDVYYKAVEEAKKYATATATKNNEITSFGTTLSLDHS